MLPPPSTTAVPGFDDGDSVVMADRFCRRNSPVGERAAARPLAFTLVELLVVMGIIIVLLGLMVPTFKTLLGGREVESSINSATGLLELGRATAVANRTYVWVLFKNVVNSDKQCELRCAAVMSANNQSSATATDITNLKPITKLIRIINVKNVSFKDMPAAVQNATPTELKADDSFLTTMYTTTPSTFPAVTITGESFAGAPYIRFDPDGEIGTSADPYNLLVEPKICLGLIPTRGTSPLANANDGAIIAAYGGSGTMRIIRP